MERYLTFWEFTISCVACNLLHEQTTHGTLFNFLSIHDFVQQVARYDYMVQDNLSTKEHINRTFYVRIVIPLIYRDSEDVYA